MRRGRARARGAARRAPARISDAGIAGRIAGVVIADMPELGSLDRKAAASLAGLAPHPDQTGALPGRNTIAGGRPCLRTAFYMAGMVAARCDCEFWPAFAGNKGGATIGNDVRKRYTSS